MRSLHVDIDGPVHVADFGGGGPPIVLVHGLGGSHVNWITVGHALAERGRVLAPDLVGFGRTPPDGRSSAVGANLHLLSRFLFEVVGEPAVLIGNSMGGYLSASVAARHPELVDGLVLVGPALPRPLGAPVDRLVAGRFALYAVPGLARPYMGWRRRRLSVEGVVRETLALCTVDPSRIPTYAVEAHVALGHERAQMPWADGALLQAARSLIPRLAAAGRVRTMLRSIRAPALIVHGDRDRLVPLAAARAVARDRRGWDLVVVEDTGHVPQLERPERFLEIVGEWLRRSVTRDGAGATAGASAT